MNRTFPAESSADSASPSQRRVLRCPSCCSRVELPALQPGDWRVLHRCGDHVIEVDARVVEAPTVWRWRAVRA